MNTINLRRRSVRATTTVCASLSSACALLLLLSSSEASSAAEQRPTKIAVFEIELEDTSAGGGIIAKDQFDIKYLKEATEEAKAWLSKSGRYSVVEPGSLDEAPVRDHTLHSCSGCIGPITQKLGAEQALIGTITRINRTEYTLQLQFFDANGASLSNYYTNLRMGANYAWPRGVIWLMKNQILAKKDGP